MSWKGGKSTVTGAGLRRGHGCWSTQMYRSSGRWRLRGAMVTVKEEGRCLLRMRTRGLKSIMKKSSDWRAREGVTKRKAILWRLRRKCGSVAKLCPTLCDLRLLCPWILQARRILEGVAISFPRESSWPRGWTWVSCIACGFFTDWASCNYVLDAFLPHSL